MSLRGLGYGAFRGGRGRARAVPRGFAPYEGSALLPALDGPSREGISAQRVTSYLVALARARWPPGWYLRSTLERGAGL